MGDELRIGTPRLERSTGGWRVSAEVGETEVWFECEDAALLPSTEGFGSAFLIPALAAKRRLVLEGPVAAAWVSHLGAIMHFCRAWWRYPQLQPAVMIREPTDAPARSPMTGLGFTGGVDSFFSLLAAGRQVDWLVFVHGFDIPLADTERARAVREQAEAVARICGARVVVVRTNLRQHPDYRSVHWGRTHGGALAAVGHMLSDRLGRLLISSSFPRMMHRPWGSHPDLDPLWSDDHLAIEHVGEDYARFEKLRLLANEPLARQYLRVCWENRDARLNCSRCGKCVRTRLMLASLGVLDAFPTLEGTSTLAASVEGLPASGHLVSRHNYDQVLQHGLPSDLDQAVRRLLRRSTVEHYVAPLRWLLRLPLRGWRFGRRRLRRLFPAPARQLPVPD